MLLKTRNKFSNQPEISLFSEDFILFSTNYNSRESRIKFSIVSKHTLIKIKINVAMQVCGSWILLTDIWTLALKVQDVTGEKNTANIWDRLLTVIWVFAIFFSSFDAENL